MESAAGGTRGMETAAGRRGGRWLLDIMTATCEVVKDIRPLIADLRDNISPRERGYLDPMVRGLIDEELHAIKGTIEELEAQLTRIETRTEAMECLREQGRKVESSTTDTQVMSVSFDSVLKSFISTYDRLHEILVSTSVLDCRPWISEVIETQYNLRRLSLETRFTLGQIEEEEARPMETAEESQGELISSEVGEEGATSIEKAAAELKEIEKANEIEGLEKAAEEMLEEKMQTDMFFDIGSRLFLSRLSNLFSRPLQDTTSLSPMHFTHTTLLADDAAASVAATLQIFSVKLQEIKEEALGSNWPLRVYGTVAARDTVDCNRNILFHRARDNCQILTEKDACLQLTGPSRAIVAIDPVDFEIDLKVKGSGEKASSQDRVLMRHSFVYGRGDNETTTLSSNDCCKIMLRCAKLENTVQATVVSVRVINWRKRAWPFKHGGKVICVAQGSVKPPDKEEEVVLQDQLTASASHDGYLDLSRQTVSVELNGKLRVIIRASRLRGHVFFPAQKSKSSRSICQLGPYELEVTVAWSLLIRDKKRCFIPRESFEHTAKWLQRSKTTLLESQSAMEIYSLLNLISKNVMKLKTDPKLRISDYNISEVKIHMGSMYRDVTSLLRMMEEGHNKYGVDAIFNGLDQLCTRLDQMGHLSYKGKSQSLSELSMDDISREAKEMEGEEEDGDAIQTEEEYFDSYRQGWIYNWSIFCGTFTETTSLSPMQFTHSTPGGHKPCGALVDSTLQIYSIKVANIRHGSVLSWPLRVYGVVAARDTVDHNRNILFSRQRNNFQILTPEDPFLRLTGPSRAIVTEEPPYVEIELKAMGTTKSEDTVLMSHFWSHSSISYIGLHTLCIPLEGDHCTMVLSAEQLGASVQATIVGIRVCVPEGRPSPFEYGGRVACSSLPRRAGKLPDSEHIAADHPSFRQVVLQDGEMITCSNGYLNLSRHVVSVESRGKLEVVIEARSQSGAMAGQVVASIQARKCNISEDVCHLGDSELKITVAWSRLVGDKVLVSSL